MRSFFSGVILGLLIFGGLANCGRATEPLFSGAGVVCAYSNVTRIYPADFDGDSLPEYALVDSISNRIEFLNYTSENLLTVTANLRTTGRPYLLCPADFNNDGFPDLAVSNKESDNITVLLNRTQVNKMPDNTPVPKVYHLTAYPNLFNSNAIISFNQPQPGRTALTIYDILGRKVETVYDSYLPAGNREFIWRADKYPSGIYFALIRSSNIAESVKLTLIK